MKFLSTIIFCLCLSTILLAQKTSVDSLLIVLNNANEDTTKVYLYSELSYKLRSYRPDTALVLAQQGMQLAQRLGFERGIARCFHDIGAAYLFADNYPLAIENTIKSLEMNQKLNNQYDIGMTLNTLGRIYLAESNYTESMNYFMKSLKIREQAADSLGMAQTFNFIGIIYTRQDNDSLALTFYQQSLGIRQRYKDYQGIGQSLNNIARSYTKLKKYDQAIIYLVKAFKLDESLHYYYGMAHDLNDMAKIYAIQKRYTYALEHYEESLELRRKAKDNAGITQSLLGIAEIYQFIENYSRAIQYAQQALALGQKIDSKELVNETYFFLAKNYEKIGDYKQAFYYQQKAIILKDSLFSLEKSKSISMLQSSYDLEKKEKEVEFLAKDKLLQQEEIENQNMQRYFFIILLLLLSLFAVFLFINNQKRKQRNILLNKQNTEINTQKQVLEGQAIALKQLNNEVSMSNEELNQANEEMKSTMELIEEQKNEILRKNEDITASIKYAKRIQTAMLPSISQINSSLADFFILYKPRDIVSGDFYWFYEINSSQNIELNKSIIDKTNKMIIVVGDCTGHGVPGAFMSMIGNDLLNQIIKVYAIFSPDQILNELHKGVRLILNQDETNAQDGMDLAICVINKQERLMEYAGAMNPLYWIQNGAIHEIKADKRPIGGGKQAEKEQLYQKHSIHLYNNMVFYLCTDGYQDQFGGQQNKKFMTKRLRELLLSVHHLQMYEQQLTLDKTIINWIQQAQEEQTDDITIWGFRID